MSKPTCSIEGCRKPADASRGWCWTHYYGFRRYGDPTQRFKQKECSVSGCATPSRSRGMCEMHYTRWKNHGDPTVRLLHTNTGPCSVPDCEQQASRLGMCEPHYWADYISRPGNAERHSAKNHSRRAKATMTGGAASERTLSWRSLHAEGLVDCHLCGLPCDPFDFKTKTDRRGRPRLIPGRQYPSLDHIIPIALGGQHVRSNAALAHMDCNRRKWARPAASIVRAG